MLVSDVLEKNWKCCLTSMGGFQPDRDTSEQYLGQVAIIHMENLEHQKALRRFLHKNEKHLKPRIDLTMPKEAR